MRHLLASIVSTAALVAAAFASGCSSDVPPVGPPAPTPEAVESSPARAEPPAPAPMAGGRHPVKDFAIERGVLKLPGPVTFETGSDKLSPVSDDILEVVHDYLDAKSDITLLRIEGHTADEGDSGDLVLSQKRAMCVGRWLVAAGIKCDRLIAVGFGHSKPIASNDTPDGKALNRRVDFVNAALRGHAIGGQEVEGGGKIAGDLCR